MTMTGPARFTRRIAMRNAPFRRSNEAKQATWSEILGNGALMAPNA
jgi:hypothetical protein